MDNNEKNKFDVDAGDSHDDRLASRRGLLTYPVRDGKHLVDSKGGNDEQTKCQAHLENVKKD